MIKYWLKFLLYCIVAAGVSATRADSYTQFFRAVDRDDDATVTSLLQRGFDVNAVNERGQPALSMALLIGSPKVAEVLLGHPQLRVEALTPAGETPLMMAALRGEVRAMQRLIDRGAQVERPGWTPLHYAAAGPEPKAVQLLLDRGVAVDPVAPNGMTPLMMGALYGSEGGIDALLRKGADRQKRHPGGATAADLARSSGRDFLVPRLTPPATGR